MFCNNCGKEVQEGVEICTNCGQSLRKNADDVEVSKNQNVNNNASRSTTNGMAIAGFVCSFFFAILGLIFSIIGLNKARRENLPKYLAIAGIVISSASIFFTIIIFAMGFGWVLTNFANLSL